MNIQRLAIPLIIIFAQYSDIFAQQLNVEGHSQIRGNMDINHMSDTTSISIGRNSGINTDYSDRRSNTFVGSYAGHSNTTGESNTYFGRSAGRENTESHQNSIFGSFAGSSNSGSRNSFFGQSAGFLTQGNQNCFYGAFAGLFNNTGYDNAFFGFEAGHDNETGNNNIAVGSRSLYINDHGFQNIAIGNEALYFNYNNYNVAVGTQALYHTNTGTQNTALGGFAGFDNNNVSSTFIGYGAGSTVGVTNGTALGFDAKVNDNNKVRIGNASVTVIEGNVAFSTMSDRRLKENIQPVPLGLEFILDLNPVAYHRISNVKEDLEMGLIAQELDSVLIQHDEEEMSLINRGNDGYLSVRYNDLLAPMIKAIQEQQKIIQEQQKIIGVLLQKTDQQENLMKLFLEENKQEAHNPEEGKVDQDPKP